MGCWKKRKVLGKGSFAKVFLASPVDDRWASSLLVAVKSSAADSEEAESLHEEGRFLAEFQGQPNILQCFGEDISVEKGDETYNLLLEYAAGGSLQDLIEKTTTFGDRCMPETHVAYYTRMLLRGISEIHSKGIVHCDLKPRNILVFPAGNGSMMNELKIADFGLARRAAEVAAVFDGGKYSKRSSRIHFDGGTPLYASPEMVGCGVYDPPCDIWAIGCIVVEMITGKRLWRCCGRRGLFRMILNESPKLPQNLSEDGKDFLKRCLEREPERRWTALKLLEHPFIVNNLKALPAELIHHQKDHQHRQQRFQIDPSSALGLWANGEWISSRDLFSTSRLQDLKPKRCQARRKARRGKEEYMFSILS